MIEHKPWIGREFEKGIDGEKIAIVGYSHWKNEGEDDYEGMTNHVVGQIVSGNYSDIRFFSDIASYFSATSSCEFWDRVLFFNFVPDVIGDGAQRFAYATREQIERGGARAKRLYAEHRIDRALIFTTKGWSDHPATREEQRDGRSLLLEGTRFTWGTY